MALRGMIFDIDGTLVDTNPSHVEAWRRAFKRFGFDIPAARIKIEIGKGGDKLVPSVLGQELEDRLGEALRRAQKEVPPDCGTGALSGFSLRPRALPSLAGAGNPDRASHLERPEAPPGHDD